MGIFKGPKAQTPTVQPRPEPARTEVDPNRGPALARAKRRASLLGKRRGRKSFRIDLAIPPSTRRGKVGVSTGHE